MLSRSGARLCLIDRYKIRFSTNCSQMMFENGRALKGSVERL